MKAEVKAGKTILQEAIEVVVGGKKYKVPPPTSATLIKVSSLIEQLPKLELDTKNYIVEVLAIAKDCEMLGEIMATFILGQPKKYSLIDRIRLKMKSYEFLHEKPSDLKEAIAKIMATQEIADFFGLTISLIDVNILRRTREVENRTTVSGQQ